MRNQIVCIMLESKLDDESNSTDSHVKMALTFDPPIGPDKAHENAAIRAAIKILKACKKAQVKM